ncbi:putative two-component system response regulator [Fibrobacter sp. UWH9]|uniref:HD domain-containing phosphohydrolase n=1 Tax=unclassified Fibrobacter TaxID=2634177 RepID=UPI00091878B8|nr:MULTISPECIES: HD domain-containing phosphohydrolase [unclassified Fibrobacter]MCQ2100022.1 response regulator [Fibrobacter sp.]MDO4947441.1 response regulator [Fibrobacter sp.]SHH63006.1 putative two-component system response regulator [Fibrobacter sp. UWH9]SHL06506.1 putative two-component system response regulator [Fibrobacter sp. UWH5]
MERARAKILVIDDTKTNIEVLEGILSNDYDIFVALNGKKALVLTEKVKPDLILLDVMMPEMDGYETLRQMHALNLVNNTPVLFLTAKADAKSEQMGLDLGAVDYITKPFNPDLVRLRIKNQLEFKQQRDHLHELVDEKTKDLRKTLKVMLTSLGALAEYRDPETGAHIKRTQVLVQMLAEKLQNHPKFSHAITSKEYIDFYATAAPLHDIGKVGIPDDILRKPAKLTDEERLVMSTHAQMGYDVLLNATRELSNHPLVKICADIILNHHERWDGEGYPNKIKGEDIPVGARLMSVADVYDALVSRRPYKEPYPHEVAVAEIKAGRGTQFDPDVVDAFMEIADILPGIYEQFKDGAQ